MAKEKKGVRLDHISKIYEDPKTKKPFYAVKDVNLDMKPGEFVTLLGPSGCGKTTILRMIAGFESPDEGEIYIGGEAVNDLTPNKRDTAMVFQSYALLPHINVFDNVAYGLKLRKFPKEVIREKVLNILKLVEMEGMESRMTNQLSGGQQQRVALARALVLEPGVLLFDEPLMRTEIRKIQQKVGITAVYVTHDQSEAMAISDNIIIMSRGHMEQMGSPRDVYYKPASKFVADFIGEANFIPVKLEKKHDMLGRNDSCYDDKNWILIDSGGDELNTLIGLKMNEMMGDPDHRLQPREPEDLRIRGQGVPGFRSQRRLHSVTGTKNADAFSYLWYNRIKCCGLCNWHSPLLYGKTRRRRAAGRKPWENTGSCWWTMRKRCAAPS